MTDYLANKGKPWSPEDLAALAKAYPNTDNVTLGRIFRRTESGIQNAAIKHGWTKSAEYMEREKPGCFKPGQAPWNKGTHFSPPGSERGRFKKGQRPTSWLPIGSERVTKDGYLERKMTDTGITRHDFVAVSHIEWEKHHGKPVPPGHAVTFRDGDKRNFAPDNLDLISRADLMRRNTFHNLPDPLPQLIQLRGALNRKINRRSKQV